MENKKTVKIMNKRKHYIFALLMTIVQGAWAWDGSGTSSDPYQIRNSADWATLASEVSNGNVAAGTAFKLMGDISISTSVGTIDHRFNGIFDGGSNTITANLSAESGCIAPFSYIESATISHLHVNGTISGGRHTAGLASSIVGTGNKIEDCRVSAQISTFSEDNKIVAGGLIGQANESTLTVEGCLFDGSITATSSISYSYAGAIVGWCSASANITVKNCIENASYSNINHVGMNYADNSSASTVSNTNSYTLNHNWSEVKYGYKIIYLSDTFKPKYNPTNTYSTTGIEASVVGLKMDDIFYAGSGETVTIESYYVDDGFIGYDFSTKTENWDNPTSSSIDYFLTMPAKDVYVSQYKDFDGNGDAAHPYLIKNEDDWQHFALNLADRNLRDMHYLLTNDIDIHVPAGGEYEHSGDLIKCYFLGTFDGGGHTITAHLSGGDYTALFYKIDGATIKNLHVAGEISGGIHSSGLVGGISAESGNSNLIENCRVSATITCSNTHAGGFVGHASSSTTTLRGCLFDGTISGNSLANVGYLVGWCGNNGNGITLEDCVAYNQHVSGASGCKMDLVLDDTGTGRCGTATNTYGGYNVGKSMVTVRNGNPAQSVTWKLQEGFDAPVEYSVSHLASYGMGLLFDGEVFIVGKNETLLFYPEAKEGFSWWGTTIDGGATLSLVGDGWHSATFTNTVNAHFTLDATIKSSGDFTGEGTEASPYLISSTADWTKLFLDLATGENTYTGKVFRLTQDIDCGGMCVGTDEHPFSGTFDGDGHTLTLNVGSEYNPSDMAKAPFYRVSEATFRHLHTAGKVCTNAQYTGGIISQVKGGSGITRLYDCHSSMTVFSTISGDASNGGLVGAASNSERLVIERCSFVGNLHSRGSATNCGGFIGWSNVPVTISQSLFDPADLIWYNLVRIGQNFARMADYSKLTIEDCYTTFNFTTEGTAGQQGTIVVDELYAPEGGSYEFVGEPDVTFNGRGYYKNGCWIRTTLDASVPFDHWQDGMNGCFISDPWTRNGLHQLKDIKQKPSLGVWTNPIPEAETERTLWGVTYRYLSRRDYHFYISDEDRIAKGWTFESDDSDANMIVYNVDGDAYSEITAVTGYKESDYNNDGVQIHNDLVGDWRNHTHLGLIAPHAFRNSTALETMYFKDTDANNYNQRTSFSFFIDKGAFENCPNFRELKMMQYTTRGDNHWEALTPTQTTHVADDAFLSCPKLKISAQADQYQNYLSSDIWKKHRSRFIVYEATTEDFTVKGVQYHWYRNFDQTEDLKNDESGKQQMLQQISSWNADYQQFNASSLLDTKDDCNVYYTSIIGVNNNDIDSNGGTMKIYNDPGSYYNYKSIVLNRDAIAGNTHVKNIEFWQTNGRSENSYSDLKMVIPNGAFRGCTNLKELRMFYYVQDGNDHWSALGPKDVIPGNNIFGKPDLMEEGKTAEQLIAEINASPIPSDFKILVATELYPDFLDDPNWQPYIGYIEPVNYSPATNMAFTNSGLTYDYMTSAGGILQSSQVVSQDVSWWTAPRIAIEVALMVYSLYSSFSYQGFEQLEGAAAAATATREEAINCGLAYGKQNALVQTAKTQLANMQAVTMSGEAKTAILGFASTTCAKQSMKEVVNAQVFAEFVQLGLCDQTTGFWTLGKWTIQGLSNENLALVKEAIMLSLEKQIKSAAVVLGERWAAFEAADKAYKAALFRLGVINQANYTIAGMKSLMYTINPVSAMSSSASLIASQCWGGSGTYNADMMNKGMRENILSNIHQVGLVGGGYVITTPQKNLVYHTYIRSVADNVEDAVIYAGFDNDNNSNTSNRTMTFVPSAFRGKTNLKTVKFHDISNQSSNTGMPFLFTIPDSAFVGCTALTEFSTLLQTDGNGTRALGPENFIFGGDSIFVGLKCQAEVDSLTNIGQGDGLVPFHIVIDPLRKEDFLASASWKPLEKYFTYRNAEPEKKYSEYGASYAYAYEQNSIKKEHKVSGHLIEHTVVVGPDDEDDYEFIKKHQGAVKLCNDIGVYNNYQLDEVMAEAFKNNQYLRSVSFVDLYGAGAFGDCYTGLQVHLGDRAFQGCSNLADLDLLYMVTDGENHITPMTPQMISIGKDVFKDSPARLKMMPQQVAWFEADDSWSEYRDRFMPCVVRFTDPGIKKALKEMAYYDPANTGTDPAKWEDYCDYARIGGAGFSWLDGKFTAQKDKIYSFADFRWFESVGLDYVGNSWFEGCSKLGNIVLPSTIKTIGNRAFNGCAALQEIELPAGVTAINDNAFNGCTSLNTIMVKGDVPAAIGSGVFHKHDNLRIFVPTDKVDEYTTAWSEYAQYIKPCANYNLYKEVTVSRVGELASKLGLTLKKENDKVRYIEGPYAKYDSLTVHGPLNGEDIAVLRHMMGANAWESEFTDGQLRYLNLWDADLKADNVNSYNGYGVDEYLEKDNWVGEYMFHNCNALESVVLPKTVTEIGENAFQEAFGLKRIAVGRNTTKYTRDLLQGLTGIEELVFLTDGHATSESSDPWEAPITQAYTLPSRLGDYLGDPGLTRQAQGITSPFSTDDIMWALASKGHFFPSVYLGLESVEGIFSYNTSLTDLDEFNLFQNVKHLEDTFTGMYKLETITLPSSIESISATAFTNCSKLKTIHVSSIRVETSPTTSEGEESGSSEGTSNNEASSESIRYIVPTLAEDAFCTLPEDFQILVPKQYCKLYRERWAQYADHINPDNTSHANEEIVTVTLTEPNTLAEKLGLTATTKTASGSTYVNGLKGDYSSIYKLKVIGPISGGDLDVMRYLAGYCPWASTRNYAGRLEYIDLYDANLVESNIGVAGYYKANTSFYLAENFQLYYVDNNELPKHAFLRAYNLKTLILPRTCTVVRERALQECEGLETLVLGDNMETFNWNALDDDAMLTRMYILAKKKVKLTTEWAIWRWLCNNYNPTFDAFYVLPSLYNDYLNDDAYTGSSWQRTNNVSKGVFEDDESFAVFASHAAATIDDLTQVYSVNGWFDNHPGAKDLIPLGFTAIDELRATDVQKLTQLEKITLPVTLTTIEDNVFSQSSNLHYVDMMIVNNDLTADIKQRGITNLGIDTQKTLVYVPQEYGETTEPNVVWMEGADLRASHYNLYADWDYSVPYAFKTQSATFSRTFTKNVPTIVCLPYKQNVPAGVEAYYLNDRDGNTLVFKEVSSHLEPLTPYLIIASEDNVQFLMPDETEVPAVGGSTFSNDVNVTGLTLRGTLQGISNATAAELGANVVNAELSWQPVSSSNATQQILPFMGYLLTGDISSVFSTRIEGEGITTDLDNGQWSMVNGQCDEWYTLDGRKLSRMPAKSGIYIKNGKKVVIRSTKK